MRHPSATAALSDATTSAASDRILKPYQVPTLTDLGAIHAVTATSCDLPEPSDSGTIVTPPPGGGGVCDWWC